MAFDKANFAIDGSHYNPNIPRVHKYYSGDDAIAAINTAGYFNDLADDLSVGDVIVVRDSAGAVAQALVASNAGGVVDITDGVVITATDSD